MTTHEPLDGYCNARKTDRSGLCRHQAGWGTDHPGTGQCKLHGGSTRNGRKHAVKLRALGEVGALLDECGVLLAGRSPVEAMIDACHRAGAMVMALGLLVEGLPVESQWTLEEIRGARDGLVGTRVDVTTAGLYGPDHLGDQKPHVLVELYGTWLDRLGRLTKTAADMGIEERRVRVEEAQTVLMAEFIRGVLTELGLWDRVETREVVDRHLGALETGR